MTVPALLHHMARRMTGKPFVQYQLELGAINSLRSPRVTEVVVNYNVD